MYLLPLQQATPTINGMELGRCLSLRMVRPLVGPIFTLLIVSTMIYIGMALLESAAAQHVTTSCTERHQHSNTFCVCMALLTSQAGARDP